MTSAAANAHQTRNISMVAGVTGREADGFDAAWNAAWSQAGPAPVLRLNLSTADAEAAGSVPFGGCGSVCERVEDTLGKSPVYAGAYLGCSLCAASTRPYLASANGKS